jgi:hypothetical protein
MGLFVFGFGRDYTVFVPSKNAFHKRLSCIGVMCQMHMTDRAPCDEVHDSLWYFLISSVHTHFSRQAIRRRCCEYYPAKCLDLGRWQPSLCLCPLCYEHLCDTCLGVRVAACSQSISWSYLNNCTIPAPISVTLHALNIPPPNGGEFHRCDTHDTQKWNHNM